MDVALEMELTLEWLVLVRRKERVLHPAPVVPMATLTPMAALVRVRVLLPAVAVLTVRRAFDLMLVAAVAPVAKDYEQTAVPDVAAAHPAFHTTSVVASKHLQAAGPARPHLVQTTAPCYSGLC